MAARMNLTIRRSLLIPSLLAAQAAYAQELRTHAGGEVTTVALDGDRVVIAGGPRLTVWDASGTPVQIGASAPAVAVLNGVALAGDLAYATSRTDLSGLVHV